MISNNQSIMNLHLISLLDCLAQQNIALFCKLDIIPPISWSTRN